MLNVKPIQCRLASTYSVPLWCECGAYSLQLMMRLNSLLQQHWGWAGGRCLAHRARESPHRAITGFLSEWPSCCRRLAPFLSHPGPVCLLAFLSHTHHSASPHYKVSRCQACQDPWAFRSVSPHSNFFRNYSAPGIPSQQTNSVPLWGIKTIQIKTAGCQRKQRWGGAFMTLSVTEALTGGQCQHHQTQDF